MKVVILLGCEGRQDNGFVFCRGAENIILDLEKHQNSENYPKLIDYVKNTVKLLDGPCCKYNVVSNTLYKFYEFGYTNDIQYKYIVSFINLHKACGIILKARIKE